MLPFAEPLVAAPMAGGPSTPELCAAVTEAGGLGYLAAGYLTPDALAEQIARTRLLTDGLIGVNLFVGDPGSGWDPDSFAAYRARLVRAAPYPESMFPKEPTDSDDAFAEKLELVIAHRVPIVSFTFGHPPTGVLNRLREGGSTVVLHATSPRGIDAIARSSDWIGVQGIGAGGHRATVPGTDEPDPGFSALDLVRYARSVSDRPIIAGGGIATPADVRKLRTAGAAAVQVGTRFLTAFEAGTKATHRQAVLRLRSRSTRLTRAFSGRLARTIENAFTATFSESAPPLYPQIHYLTAPMRAEADRRGDAEHLNLWAGTGFAHCREASAADIMAELLHHES